MFSQVANVRKPRQKSARWILVDFDTNELAEEFKKLLETKKLIANIPVKVNKLSIKENNSIKQENERQEFRNTLAKQTFLSKKLEKYSNKLLVTNLPQNVTVKDLETLFPHHQKIDLKHQTPSPKAIITYSSAKEAMDMRMSIRTVLNGQKFRVIILLLKSDSQK